MFFCVFVRNIYETGGKGKDVRMLKGRTVLVVTSQELTSDSCTIEKFTSPYRLLYYADHFKSLAHGVSPLFLLVLPVAL